MHPDEDQLGDYKAAMESLRDADSCDSCGKPIKPGAGFSISSKKAGIQNFHKNANDCASAPDAPRSMLAYRPRSKNAPHVREN